MNVKVLGSRPETPRTAGRAGYALRAIPPSEPRQARRALMHPVGAQSTPELTVKDELYQGRLVLARADGPPRPRFPQSLMAVDWLAWALYIPIKR